MCYRRSVRYWLRRGWHCPASHTPSTFSLTDTEAAAEFRALVASGWTAAEVAAVLELRGAS